MSELSKCTDSGSSDDCFLKVNSIVNESDICRGRFGEGTFLCKEVDNLSLNVSMLAVFNVFG